MGIAERKFQAAQILDPSDVTVGGKELSVMEGTLFYKRHVRRSCCHSKGCVACVRALLWVLWVGGRTDGRTDGWVVG